MFEWLNRNAAAVQALASVFSVVATVVLLRITRQYVALTQELARAAREQLRFQQRTVASEAAQLLTLIDVFLGSLKRLPTDTSNADTIRKAALWKHPDVSNFGSLAAAVLGQRPEIQRAIQRLNWLHSTVDRVQQSDPNAAKSLHDFPWADWTRQIEEARAALQAVRADAQSTAASSAERQDAESDQPGQDKVGGHEVVQELRKHENQKTEQDRKDGTQASRS